MLSGARRVHPLIVGWSIANRPLIPSPSNDDPAAAWPRATPGRNWVVLDVAPGTGWWYGLNHYAFPNWHDTGSTTPRSVGEVALIVLGECSEVRVLGHRIGERIVERNQHDLFVGNILGSVIG